MQLMSHMHFLLIFAVDSLQPETAETGVSVHVGIMYMKSATLKKPMSIFRDCQTYKRAHVTQSLSTYILSNKKRLITVHTFQCTAQSTK